MKLSLLLYILKRKLTGRIKRDPAFRERLKERDFTLLVKTRDNRHSRFFTFTAGRLVSERGIIENPDVSLIWADEQTAFRIMKSGDRNLSRDAVAEGKLQIVGNLHHSLWFTELVRIMLYF